MPLFMYLLYHTETANMKETMQADAAIGLFLSAVVLSLVLCFVK